MTIGLLTERMLDKMSNASRLVEKLRAKRLLERIPCPKDRRAVDVIITGEGLKLLKAIYAELEVFEKQHLNISKEDAEALNRLLDKMRS